MIYLYYITNNLFIKYNREYPIRTDVIFQSNKFQAYHFKPLSQFSFSFVLFYKQILLIKVIYTKINLPKNRFIIGQIYYKKITTKYLYF